ncbi:MAG: TBC domain-containing protein [Firmicutes bacterium]|nr:TBC domain-containing protein [Bacillota bacterium]
MSFKKNHDKVACGKIFNKVVLSFLMATLIGARSSGVSFAESTKISIKSPIDVNLKKSKTSTNIVETIKNNKGKTAATACLAILGSILGVKVIKTFGNQKKTSKNVQSDLEFYENVEPDLWFKRLGGTREHIDKYVNILNNHDQEDYAKRCAEISEELVYSNLKTIDADAHRTFPGQFEFKTCNEIGQINKENILPRILKFLVLEKEKEDRLEYIQGFNFIGAMVILKFLDHDDAKNYTKEKLKEEEAKIYYVYKTIMQSLYKFIDEILKSPTSWRNLLKDDHFDDRFSCAFFHFVAIGLSAFVDDLEKSHFIKFWDNVILKFNDSNTIYDIAVKFLEAGLKKLNEKLIDEARTNRNIDDVEQLQLAKEFLKEINNDYIFNELLNETFS